MKQRIVGLDGLRGLAALIVLLHHSGQDVLGGSILPAGYLAVDFFFLLSGFIISAVYQQRFVEGWTTFAVKRFWRLVPTMWIGILLGFACSWWFGGNDFLATFQLVCAVLFLPIAFDRFGIFILNGVQWSLFFELFANAAHATVFWQMRTRALFAASLLAFGLLAVAAWYFGSVSVGDRGPTFVAGFARVFASYLAGIVLFRMKDKLPAVPVPPSVLLLVLVVGAGMISPRWIIELLAVALMPLVLVAGVQQNPMFPRLAQWAGWLSYPLYAVHLPTLYFVHHFVADIWARFALDVGLSIGMAWVVAWLISRIEVARYPRSATSMVLAPATEPPVNRRFG